LQNVRLAVGTRERIACPGRAERDPGPRATNADRGAAGPGSHAHSASRTRACGARSAGTRDRNGRTAERSQPAKAQALQNVRLGSGKRRRSSSPLMRTGGNPVARQLPLSSPRRRGPSNPKPRDCLASGALSGAPVVTGSPLTRG
jgi:hypothetical protein